LVISQRIGDQERAVLGGAFRFVSWIELGDLSSADVELAQMHSVATQLGQPAQISWVTICHAMRALLTGALSEAEKLIHEVLRLGERAETWVTAWHRMQLCALRREQGRLAEIEQTVQQSLGEHRNYPIWRCVLTYLHAAAGDLGKAREGFEDLARDQFRSLPVDEEWTYGMTLLTEVCVALADVERAETLYQLLVPYSRLVAYGAPEVSTGAVSRYLGMLAASLSRWNDAEQRFRHALQLNTKIQAAPWLARTQVDYGHMLISRGAPGDRTHADQLIGQAVATFQSLGMRSHAARASTLELHTQLVG
jgi:tetratricopeptide (TPR) repeat protein